MKRVGVKRALVIVAALLAMGGAALGGRYSRSTPEPARDEHVAQSIMLTQTRSQVRSCLNDRIRALLELGERDVEILNTWAVRRCGEPLKYFLIKELERPAKFSDAYVAQVTRAEIDVLMRRYQ